jgi:cyclopropane fatty-acyl-phospholipid synthase-like methyltransferase
MFNSILAKNLRKPMGIVGRILGIKFKSNLIEYDELEKYLDLNDRMQLLEIGYGPGFGMNQILEHNDVFIDGIDFSELMYRTALKNTEQHKSKVQLINADFNDYSFGTKKYDRIYLLNVIYFWNDIEHSIKKLIELMKANGKIVIGMANPELLKEAPIRNEPEFNMYSIDSVVDIFKKNKVTVEVNEHPKIRGCFYIVGENC